MRGERRTLDRTDLMIAVGPGSLAAIHPVSPINHLHEVIGLAQATSRYASTSSVTRPRRVACGSIQVASATTALQHVRDSFRERHTATTSTRHA